MAKQKQDDQPELTYSSYVRTQDVTQKTCRRRWTIRKSGERWSRISVLAARHDDDDYYWDRAEYSEESWRLEENWCRSHFCGKPSTGLEAGPHKAAAVRPPTTHHEIRRNRHAGQCWRSRDELIRDVLLLTPSYVRAKAGRPARTYMQQLCKDTGV